MNQKEKQETIKELKNMKWVIQVWDETKNIFAPTLQGEIFAVALCKYSTNDKIKSCFDQTLQNVVTPMTIQKLFDLGLIIKFFDINLKKERIGLTDKGNMMLTALAWLIDSKEQKKQEQKEKINLTMKIAIETLDKIIKKTREIQENQQLKKAMQKNKKPINTKQRKRSQDWWDI